MMRTATAPDAIRPYLPPPLIRAWTERGVKDPVWIERIEGTLMHCDVTGFTAMSERLAARGKEGAEIISGVLNKFFTRMLGISDAWGGAQIKFGGDAMLLLFEGAEHEARAAVAALEMQRAMKEFRSVDAGGEKHTLRMRIGAHCGEFFGASVGDPDNLLHFLFFGPDVNRTAEVEPAAPPGRVAVSDALAAELKGKFNCFPLSEGVWCLSTRSRPGVQCVAPDRESRLPRLATRYVHPHIVQRLVDGSVALSGEHRRITCVFINALGLARVLEKDQEAAALSVADSYMRLVLDSLARHGGYLLGSDAAEEGDKLIAIFGAPISQSNPEAAALRFAVELDRGLQASDLPLTHSIGVNMGFAFAGEIGCETRRDYTVLGDTVNTAARLMSAAGNGGVVVSDETLEAAGHSFAAKKMRPLRLKGKAHLVRASRLLTGATEVGTTEVVEQPLIGRDNELSAVLRVARKASRGRALWVRVSGEAGIGKSRLVRELDRRFAGDGWRVFHGRCNAHSSHVPFGMWTGILQSLFKVEVGGDTDRVAEVLTSLAPGHERAAELIAGVLSLTPVRPSATGGEEVRDQRAALTGAVVAALSGAAASQPLLLTVEDTQWIDEVSSELLARVLAESRGRILAVTTTRESRGEKWEGRSPTFELALGPLPEEDARRLILSSAGDIDDSQIESVLDRAGGNPLLLGAFARSKPSGDGSQMPETVEDAIMSTIDTLPRSLADVARAASVVGPRFEVPVLMAVAGDISRSSLSHALSGLTARGLCEVQDGKRGVYFFAHAVIRDVVYGMLPFAQRRRMHHRVIDHLEGRGPGGIQSLCELLLYHAENAVDDGRIIRYACMSGDRAAGIYASEAAVDYFRRALDELDGSTTATADRCLLLERIADSLETMGRHRDATEHYRQALDAWGSTRRVRRVRFVDDRAPGPELEAILCRKTAVSLERAAEFEESLRWLDRALAALPAGRPRLSAQIAGAKSVSLFRRGFYEEGIVWGQRALKMANRSRDRRLIAYSHNMLATSYMESGALRRAIGHLRRAVRIYHEIGDLPGQASANNNLGMCYHLQGVLDGALYHYEVALRTDEKVGDLVDAVIVRSNIGEVLMTQGRLEEAIDSLEIVISAHAASGELGGVTGLAHINMARCRAAQGSFSAADRHLRIAAHLLNSVGQQGLHVESQLERAELLLLQGRREAAARTARHALRRAQALSAGLLEARGERLVGRVLAERGDLDSATRHLRLSVTLARRASAGHEEARALVVLGKMSLEGGRKRAAADLFRRALRLLRQTGSRLEIEEARGLLSEAEG
jgi:class 3 adenylate cyclase/tetratricopeptide (TPR) repeat protein